MLRKTTLLEITMIKKNILNWCEWVIFSDSFLWPSGPPCDLNYSIVSHVHIFREHLFYIFAAKQMFVFICLCICHILRCLFLLVAYNNFICKNLNRWIFYGNEIGFMHRLWCEKMITAVALSNRPLCISKATLWFRCLCKWAKPVKVTTKSEVLNLQQSDLFFWKIFFPQKSM